MRPPEIPWYGPSLGIGRGAGFGIGFGWAIGEPIVELISKPQTAINLIRIVAFVLVCFWSQR